MSNKVSRLKLLTNKILVTRSAELKQQTKSLESDNSFLKSITLIGKQTKRNINVDFTAIRNNRRLLVSILSTANALRKSIDSKVTANKTDAVADPLERFKNGGSSGLLGALGLGATIIGKVFNQLAGPVIKSIGKITKWITSLAIRLGITGAKFAKSAGETIWDWISNRGTEGGKGKWKIVNKTKSFVTGALPRITGAVSSRLGTQIVARLGIGAVATVVGGTAAAAAGIGLLATAVGYGSYKLATFFELSEKLDNVISKITGGKYRDLADILLGIQNGDVATDLMKWLKTSALSFFTKGYDYIKSKITGLLEKLNPFSGGKKADAVEVSNAGGSSDSLKEAMTSITKGPEPADEAEEAVLDSDSSGGPPAGGQVSASGSSSIGSSIAGAVSGAVSSIANSSPVKAVTEGVSSVAGSVIDAGKSALDTVTDFFTGGPKGDSASGTSGLVTHFPMKSKSLSSAFGMRFHPEHKKMMMHNGVDIGASIGSPVFAAKSGTVKYATWVGGYGNAIQLDHGNGVTTLYGHLDKYGVKAGQKVQGGQKIAESGNTGVSSGPHLHFEIAKNGVRDNPVKHLKFTGKTVMGKNGYSRAPNKGELGYGGGSADGGSSMVKGLVSDFDQVASQRAAAKESKYTPPAMPFVPPQLNSVFSGGATIETTSAQVQSPRLLSPSISLVSESVFYT